MSGTYFFDRIESGNFQWVFQQYFNFQKQEWKDPIRLLIAVKRWIELQQLQVLSITSSVSLIKQQAVQNISKLDLNFLFHFLPGRFVSTLFN